jgi:transposase
LAQLATDGFTAVFADLNPIERIWLTIKARWFNNYVCKNEETLLERSESILRG